MSALNPVKKGPTDPVAEALVDRVLDAFDRCDLPGTELAKALGLTPGAISRIRTERSVPGGATLARMAQVLGIDGHWLLTGEGEMFRRAPPFSAVFAEERRRLRELRLAYAELEQLITAREAALAEREAALCAGRLEAAREAVVRADRARGAQRSEKQRRT